MAPLKRLREVLEQAEIPEELTLRPCKGAFARS